MKLTLLSKLLLPVGLLAFGAISAYAAPVDCSTITTIQGAIDANGGGGCTVGNLTFSNFMAAPLVNGNVTAGETLNLSNVAFSITTDGSGDYSVIADFSCNTFANTGQGISGCTASSPEFAVQDSATGGQVENLGLTYLVTENLANTTITYIDGLAQLGINTQGGNTQDANGSFTKTACAGGAFSDSTGAGCTGNTTTVQSSTWNEPNNGQNADPTLYGSQSQQSGYAAVGDGSFPLPAGQTTFGVSDQTFIYSGDDSVLNTQFNAAVGFIENDFTETTSGGAPEPATFVLLGGALVGLGVIRRKKSA
jgi:hypothetical protein